MMACDYQAILRFSNCFRPPTLPDTTLPEVIQVYYGDLYPVEQGTSRFSLQLKGPSPLLHFHEEHLEVVLLILKAQKEVSNRYSQQSTRLEGKILLCGGGHLGVWQRCPYRRSHSDGSLVLGSIQRGFDHANHPSYIQ